MIKRARLLTAVMLLAAVGLVFKITNLVESFTPPASAVQEEEAAPVEDAAATDVDADSADATGDDTVPEFLDPLQMSRSELDVLQNLGDRRRALDARDQEQDLRDGLLNATEQRIDTKIARLQELESVISAYVATFEREEADQLNRVVKMYESMKPKAAAPIFEALDLPIQVEVATNMKEAKMSAILAAMSTEAARMLTTELATRVELPSIEG